MKKIVCFGDSNTYGYDPRSFLGDRYPEDRIWTSLVAAAFEGRLEVVNRGRNGRTVPCVGWDYRYVEQLLSEMTEQDLFIVMLGSNDIFMTMTPDAEEPIVKMDKFLQWLSGRTGHPEILVVAPPYPEADTSGDPAFVRFAAESASMNRGFKWLASKFGLYFLDASEWNVDLAFDNLHFSVEGHRTFAEHLIRWLEEHFPDKGEQ